MLNIKLMRAVYFIVFVFCAMLMTAALYMQYVMGLEPCPLCMLQRTVFILIGIVALIAFLHNAGARGDVVYGASICVFSLIGMAISWRHVKLQNLPPHLVPECGPGLGYLIENFPIVQSLDMIWTGSGECAEVQWRFLYLSIPEWTLMFFALLFIAGIFISLRMFFMLRD